MSDSLAGRRVLLVDDHPLVRDGLRAALRRILPDGRFEEAGSAAEALERVAAVRPHLVLLDVNLPDGNGLHLAREIRAAEPRARLLMVAGEVDPWTIRESLEAGASGYMAKTNSGACLAEAVREVLGGGEFLCADSRAALDKVAGVAPAAEDLPGIAVLSQREREVLRHLAHGENTKEIAAILGISPKTVETHRQHITRKLGTSSIAVLTRYALRHGLTPP